MNALKIYCAGPITGMNGNEVFEHYDRISLKLKEAGYQVFHPMIGKEHMRDEANFKSSGHIESPITNDKAIYGRDQWMVKMSDIVYADFTRGADKVSIGSCFELAWASILGKQTIVVIPDIDNNAHNHAFIKEAANIVFSTTEEALEYLKILSNDVVCNI